MTVCKLLARMVEPALMGLMSISVIVILGFLDAIVTQTLMSAVHHLVGMVEFVWMASPSIIASAKQASQVKVVKPELIVVLVIFVGMEELVTPKQMDTLVAAYQATLVGFVKLMSMNASQTHV